MHSSTFILPAAAALGANAYGLQVNYFSDGGCQDYILAIYPPPDGSCYDYNWKGQNSVALAESTYPHGVPVCTYYTGEKCTGAYQTEVGAWPKKNCASNWGHGFVSLRCHIVHELKN